MAKRRKVPVLCPLRDKDRGRGRQRKEIHVIQQPQSRAYIQAKLIQKDPCTPVYSSTFTTTKTWKQPQCPSTDNWIEKMHIHTMEYHP